MGYNHITRLGSDFHLRDTDDMIHRACPWLLTPFILPLLCFPRIREILDGGSSMALYSLVHRGFDRPKRPHQSR